MDVQVYRETFSCLLFSHVIMIKVVAEKW